MATGEFDYTNMLIDGLGQNNNHSGILVPLIPFPEVSTVFFLHLHADHADCAYEPAGKIEDCM